LWRAWCETETLRNIGIAFAICIFSSEIIVPVSSHTNPIHTTFRRIISHFSPILKNWQKAMKRLHEQKMGDWNEWELHNWWDSILSDLPACTFPLDMHWRRRRVSEWPWQPCQMAGRGGWLWAPETLAISLPVSFPLFVGDLVL
jgi:hypothetical protein